MSSAITHLKQLEGHKEKMARLTLERDMALRAEEDAVEIIFQLQQQFDEIYKLVAAVMTRGAVGQQDYRDLNAVKSIAIKNKGKK